MKIVFDIDGTLTDFEKFIIENKNYIEQKYFIELTNLYGYDVDEMFDIKNKFEDVDEGKKKSKEIMSDFWNKYYFKYLMSEFRVGVKDTLNRLVDDGYEVIIVSSRNKTCEQNIVGKIVRKSTIYRLKKDHIKYSDIIFCPSDEDKINYINSLHPDVVVDDKPKVLNSILDTVHCICISSNYNISGLKDGIVRIDSYQNNDIYNEIEKIRKKKNVHNKIIFHYPNLKKSERNFKLVKHLISPYLKHHYHPIILHKENISDNKPLIYAPNHRSTLDPYFITYSSNDAIHWDALKRFFTSEDSIFNNNKNFVLRKLTAYLFRELGYIPINRGGDNQEAIEVTNYCLKNGSSIGIFPEGTTNKNPSKQELLDIKNGLFYFAKENNVEIQPISITWFPKEFNTINKVVLNYCMAFSMENLTIEEGKQKWVESVLKGIDENKEIINSQING